MAITVEYGKCGKCGDNNVKTAQVCRACSQPLPWAKPAKASVAAAPSAAGSPIIKHIPKVDLSLGFSAGFYMQVLGGIIFVAGCALWLGNKTGLMPTVPFAGMTTAFIGASLWGTGAAMDNHGADG